jgi:hypothetical protein
MLRLLFFALFAIYISIMVYKFYWMKEEEVGSFDLKPIAAMVNQRFDYVRSTINVVEAPVTLFMRMTGLHTKRFNSLLSLRLYF